jgi:arylsulfatase
MTPDQPNIVMVSIDSLRADHCGHGGYDRETTPAMDEIAREGLVFDRALAPAPATHESMPPIFTGSYPTYLDEEEGKDVFGKRQDQIRRHMRTRETVPQSLNRLGYTTGGFTPNPTASRHFSFDVGFDHFQDFFGDETRRRLFEFVKGSSVPMLKALVDWAFKERSFKPWEAYYDEVTEWARSTEEPYFLWVFLMEPHTPYFVPREYRSENSWLDMMRSNWELQSSPYEVDEPYGTHDELVSAYDDTVRYADAFVEAIRRDLSDTDPVLLVHSDHGEGFLEHDSYYHTRYLYQENLHVPFLVDNAGVQREVTEPVSLRSIPAIVRAIARGDDLSAFVDEHVTSEYVVSRTRQGKRLAVQNERWKVIVNADRMELYDLRNDPDEQENLLPTDAAGVEQFLPVLQRFLDDEDEREAVARNARALAEERV